MATYRHCSNCGEWRDLSKIQLCDCTPEPKITSSKRYNINVFKSYNTLVEGKTVRIKGAREQNLLCNRYKMGRVEDYKTTQNNPKQDRELCIDNNGVSSGF